VSAALLALHPVYYIEYVELELVFFGGKNYELNTSENIIYRLE
jgi:hypothetical protein